MTSDPPPVVNVTRLVIENAKRKKCLADTFNEFELHDSLIIGRCVLTFWLGEIQFNQSQAWIWSHMRASHCLWSN